jgi:HK97 family phage major capsid protein
MLPNRAYSVLDVKAFDSAQRTFRGIATSPRTDRMGDVIDPAGVTFARTLPLLLYHDSHKPVGEVRFGKATAQGIPFDARISQVDRSGAVADRINEAIDSLTADPPLIRAVSIGFRALEDPTYNKETGGFNFGSIEVLELSMVVIPANADATIENAKAYDVDRPALGVPVERQTTILPGASGTSRVISMRWTHSMKKSYAEQITTWEATRQAKAAEQEAVQQKALDEGRAKDEAEKEKFNALSAEIKGIDSELVDLRALEVRERAAAVEVKGNTTADAGLSRGTQRITVTRELPKGFLFARYAICMANSRGIPGEAIRLAKEHYPDDPGVLKLVEKTAVAGGATSGSHYLDDMVPYNVMNDFIEYLRPGSIIGKFGGPNPGAPGRNYPSLRRVGFNERVSGMSTGYTAGWKGEGLPALPSAAVTFNTSLTWNCMAALAVLTKEAIRFSNPNAEAQVRDDLARAVNAKLDIDFVDPAKAASGTTSPASITNGVVATGVSGTGATNVRHDLAVLLAAFATNKLDPSDIVLIMSGTMASQISMMVNALGQPDFPALSDAGGYLAGKPVIVSEHLTAVGSPSTQSIIAVKASDVYLADDGVVTVEASDQASIEMVDTSSQSGISGTGASLVSLWQSGLVGLMANREITWKLRRATAVQYISPAAYAVPTS